MQPARFRQADFLLVEINNAKSTRPAVSSGEKRGLLSRTAAGKKKASLNMHPILFFMYTISLAAYRHFQEKLHSMLFSIFH